MTTVSLFETLTAAWLAWLPVALLETTLVAAFLLIVVRLGRRLSSPLRYGLVCVALLKFLIPPVVSLPTGVTSWIPTRRVLAAAAEMTAPSRTGALAAVAAEMGALPHTNGLENKTAPLTISEGIDTAGAGTRVETITGATGGPLAPPEGTTGELLPTGREPTARLADGPTPRLESGAQSEASAAQPGDPAAAHAGQPTLRSLAALLFLLHAAGSLLMAARVMRQHRRLQSVLHRCMAADDAPLLAAYRRECRRARVRRQPALVLSPDGFGPAAIGTLRRRIVVPTAAARRVPEQLRPVLAHELAHHRRCDLWIEALVMGLAVLWWFNPAYWLVARELRRLREDCCDEAVLAGGRTSMASYCQCLLDVASAVRGAQPAGATLLNGSRSHPLARRIERMMNSSFAPTPRLSPGGAAALAVAALFLLPGAGHAAGASVSPEQLAAPAPAATRADDGSARMATSQETAADAAQLPWQDEDRVANLNRRAIDRLVRLGLDRDFIEARRDEGDRTVRIEELRSWVAFGVDAALVDELAVQNIDELEVSELFRLISLEVDGSYLAGLRGLGYEHLTVSEITYIARYDIDAAFISSFRAVGYEDLSFEEMVRLKRYDVPAEFVGDLQETGYADLSVDDLVTLTRYDIAAEYIKQLSDLGYVDLEVEDLVRLRRYGIEIEFIETLGELGRENLSIDDLVTLNRYEVDPAFVVQVNELGYSELSVQDLVRLKRYGVALDTMRRLQELGFADLSVDGMVTLTRYEVDLDYITAMRQLGVETTEVQDLVTLQRYSVGPEYVAALAAAGYDALDVDDLVRLRRYDVEADYLTELREAGLPDLSVDDIVTLQRYGIEAAYLGGLDRIGYGDLSVGDIVRLHRYGVEVEFIERLQNAGFEALTVDKIINLKRHS